MQEGDGDLQQSAVAFSVRYEITAPAETEFKNFEIEPIRIQ
jgi:hypothetical protein